MDMTPEFIVLAFVLVLAIVQIGWAASARTAELGLKWNAGPRDGEAPPPGKLAGRLIRAQANLFETLPIFAAATADGFSYQKPMSRNDASPTSSQKMNAWSRFGEYANDSIAHSKSPRKAKNRPFPGSWAM